MCNELIIFKTTAQCKGCFPSHILHQFLFKQGSTNPVKNKYYCESCGLRYEPTKENKLDFFFEERKTLAQFLLNETCELKIIQDVPANKIFSITKEGLHPYTPHLTSLFFIASNMIRVNKNDILNQHEKVQVFVPDLGYKEFYIPFEYVKK